MNLGYASQTLRHAWRVVVSGCLLTAAPALTRGAPVSLPADPAFWQRLETLPPTPCGESYLRDIKPGQFVQFRFAMPTSRPAAYRVNLDNIVAMSGNGSSYQVEIHVDAPAGPLLYKGAVCTSGSAFNAEDLSRLEVTPLLSDRQVEQGYVDLFATAWVEGDTWTTYRDQDGSRWDLFAVVPEATAFARWEKRQAVQAALAERGVFVLPQPQQIEVRAADLPLRDVSVHLSGSVAAPEQRTAAQLAAELSERLGRAVGVVAEPRSGQVRLVLAADRAALSAGLGFDPGRDLGPQGYALDVDSDGVVVAAAGSLGLFYGTQTLAQLLAGRGATATVRGVRIVDWPDLPKRMVQYDIARGNTVNVDYWKRWIREFSRLKINQIMLYMEDDYHFEKYPFLGRPNTFTAAKARELVAYAEDWHVELVPQIESLGHADALLAHAELADLRLAGSSGAICPDAERTLPVLDDLFGELAAAFPQSDLLHVGGDEVWGFARDPRCAERVKAAGEEGVYAFHLNNLQTLLAKRGRVMAFWGDEVLAYPKVADGLRRDAVVFDWHYGDQSAYPSIEFFQGRGFRRIYACPAVHGYFDVYPQYRLALGNIAGFTRAAVECGVEGVCCTTWGMNRGGNAENYLYGLAYAAQCGWNVGESELGPFDERFAGAWLGLPDARDSRRDIDAAFWFAWREPDRGTFWQRLFAVSEFLFGGAANLVAKCSVGEVARLERDAAVLTTRCDEAEAASLRLRSRATRNLATLDALEQAVRIHRHVAGKVAAVARLHREYRDAYVAVPREAPVLAAALERATADLTVRRLDFAALRAGFEAGIRERGGDPLDLKLLEEAARLLEADLARLGRARADIAQGKPPADPMAIGLGPRLLQRVGQWHTADINPSDREHPRRIVVELTAHIDAPGTYEVEWDYTAGADGLDIVSTGLFWSAAADKTPADLRPLALDVHPAFTGAADRGNLYHFTVAELPTVPGRRLFLVGQVYNQRTFETHGDIWLRRGWAD